MSDTSLPLLDWRVVFNHAAPPGRRGWGRVRAAQINELSRVFKIVVWGQTVNALLLVLILRDTVPAVQLAGWIASIVALMVAVWSPGRRRRRRSSELYTASRQTVQQVAYHSVFFAIIWGVPASLFVDNAGAPQQLAVAIITAGMMAGAAFVLAPVPAAACGFVLIMGGAITRMLVMAGSPMIATIAPAYIVGLLMIIAASGRAFMQHRCERLALDERTETVSLLLREYESSDADWLWSTGSNLVFRNVSHRFARAFGRDIDEVARMSLWDLVGNDTGHHAASAGQFDQVQACLRERKPVSDILIPVDTATGTRCIEISARPQFSQAGKFIGYRGVGSDVTEARRAADRIAHMARHDSLTGLPNRLQLLEKLGVAATAAEASGSRCAVLLIDLDRFKLVNDSLGHVAGDDLLKQVSARFEPIITARMTAGRLGGDEFAVIIPDAPDDAGIRTIGQAIIAALSQPFTYHQQHLFVGASIGVAFGPGDGATVEELIRNADLALYSAKDRGGNHVCFYDPSLHARAEERRQIELALRAALDNEEMRLEYQPVITAATGRIESCEALLRWRNPALGDISPAGFIPLAEETGLIVPIGQWVLRTACAEAARWPSDISLAVNISPRQLAEPSFMTVLVSALSHSGLDASRLELEITETVFLNITPQTRRVLQQIRRLGVRLAMDDFGTGYSSLGYLREADFDTLKIDQSFVRATNRGDPESGCIVRAVVALAGSLGMKTVAEGVETEEQLGMMRELGCDCIQGYIFSPAIAPAALRTFFDREPPALAMDEPAPTQSTLAPRRSHG